MLVVGLGLMASGVAGERRVSDIMATRERPLAIPLKLRRNSPEDKTPHDPGSA